MAGVGSEDRLQQYFDGELADADAAELRAELESDEALRAKLEGLAHLRTLMVAAAEEQGDEVDSEALWSGITAKLGESAAGDDPMLPAEEAEPAGRPALSVVQGGKRSEGKRSEPVAQPARRSNVVWIGITATLAVAAAVLLVVLRPWSGTGETDVPLAAAPPPGSEIVEVDFGYSTGAIFSVEGQEGEHYAVVWISDEKPEVEDETEERVQ